MGIGGKIEIDHRIGDTVAHFVGVTLRHGFAGEDVICPGHLTHPCFERMTHGQAAAFVLANHSARGGSSPPSNSRDSKFDWDLRGATASAECPHQVDHALADLGIADLDEGAIEIKSFAAI